MRRLLYLENDGFYSNSYNICTPKLKGYKPMDNNFCNDNGVLAMGALQKDIKLLK